MRIVPTEIYIDPVITTAKNVLLASKGFTVLLQYFSSSASIQFSQFVFMNFINELNVFNSIIQFWNKNWSWIEIEMPACLSLVF